MNLREKLEALVAGKALTLSVWSDGEYIELSPFGNNLIDESGDSMSLSILELYDPDYKIYDKKSKIKNKIKELKSELKKLEKQLSEN